MAFSRVVLTGDGTTTQFAVNFALDYLLEADVTCRVGTEVDGSGDPSYRTITFLSTNLLQVGGAVVADEVPIVFERTVHKDVLRVDYNNGDQLDEDNLMIAQKQAMMAIHEVLDGRSTVNDAAAASAEAAERSRVAAELARDNTEADAASTANDVILATAAAAALGNQVHQYDTRAQAVAATIPVGVQAIKITRYATGYPLAYATYIPGTAAGTLAFQEAGGHWWQLDTSTSDEIDASWFGVTGAGIVDDTAALNLAVEIADGRWVKLPAGDFRTTGIVRLTSTTVQFRNGMKLRGQGTRTSIILTANNGAAFRWDVGYVPNGTTTPTLKYTRGSALEELRITQAAGVTNGDGIRLTAAWNVRFRDVVVEGMSGHGVTVPFRSDIYAAVSDYWQCYQLSFDKCTFSGCTGVGVYLVGGQSPGGWEMTRCTIANNPGGGVITTTGQFKFSDNLIVANGTNAVSGGMLIDASIEGVSFNACIERNEFDTNFLYHLKLIRVRNIRITGNRFLSSTYNSATGNVLTPGSAFMRPSLHVVFGQGDTKEVLNSAVEGNYHRSITGASTTAAVSAYIKFPSSTQILRNRFVNNDIDNRDGVNQNSSGMVMYDGIVGTDANLVINGNIQIVTPS